MKKLLLILVVWPWFPSCTSEADLAIPETKPELVIHGFLNPNDSIHKIQVTSTFPSIGKVDDKPKFVNNALVKLIHREDTVTLRFQLHPDTPFYFVDAKDFSLKHGERYELYAEAVGFESVRAATTLPDTIVTDFDYELSRVPSGAQDSTFYLRLSWKELNDKQNYYCVRAGIIDSVLGVSGIRALTYPFFFNTALYEGNSVNGSLIISNRAQALLYAQTAVVSRTISISLLTVDSPYFLYHKSIEGYSIIDPFKQPSNIFTNITNGKGVFCSYRETYYSFKLF